MKNCPLYKRTFSLLALLLVISASALAADTPLWTFDGAKWYTVLDTGNVMVGNKTSVSLLEGATGKQIWTRADLGEINENEFSELEGTPLLLFADNSGWAQRKTKLTAVDGLTGETVWQSDKMLGFTVAVVPDYRKDLLVFLTIKDNRMNKDKPDMFALKMSTGQFLWQAEYPEKVDLYGVEKKKCGGAGAMLLGSGGGASDRFDLSGENPPIFDGDSLYLTYAGLHRYSLADGKLVWKNVYDVTDGSLKNTNGQAIVDGDTIFTSAQGIIRAIDKNSGAIKWTTKDFGKGGIAEMQLHGDVIYGRMGGQFFSAKKGEWQEKNPVGVVALNKASGNTNWIYTGADESITNMVVLPNDNVLLIADKSNLIGLDMASQGKVKEAYKVKLQFKRALGAADVGGKAAAIAFGGIGGAFKKGAKRTDNPVSLVRQENGTVVVRGMQHLLAFNPATREIAWSNKYPAPGISGWESIVMTALTITAAAVNQSLEAGYMQRGDYNSAFNENSRFLNMMSSYQQFMGRKYNSSKQSGNVYYVLTKIKGDGDSGSGLVGINMLTGNAERQIVFNDKSPDYEVDETDGRLFNMNKGKLSAFPISDKPEQRENKEGDK
ncbi:MAG: PQQ-binding-like beta-propeller repeat protein [Pyrinomonadaceae bacterium]|nr:PQQ-binding-like beta-propeller repeat protein [Pyrinomonadaceae bacterium]